MVAVRGSLLLIKRGNGDGPPETFTTVGALQNATVTFNGNPIDVTTANDVDAQNEIFQSYITGVKSMTVSGNGFNDALEPVQSVYEDWAAINSSIQNYQVVVPFVGTWTVPMIVGEISFEGPYDNAVSFNISLQASGPPTFVAETA